MKCLRRKCDGSLSFDGYAGMGSFHSNYYKCPDCGNIYKIYDHNSFPPSLVVEGMKCLYTGNGQYMIQKYCSSWNCRRWNSTNEWKRFHSGCGYRVKWSSKRKTPKKEKPIQLTYLEKNALRVRELEVKMKK